MKHNLSLVMHELVRSAWLLEERYVGLLMPVAEGFLQGQVQEVGAYHELQQPDLRAYVITPNGDTYYDAKETDAKEVVHVLPLQGVLMKHGSSFSYGLRELAYRMQQAEADSKVVAHVMHLETPGGSVYGTKLMDKVLAGIEKPILSWVDDICASAGMWLASYADEIYANDAEATIGSIGTMATWIDLTGKYEKEGAKVHMVNATKSTMKNAIWKEADKGNYKRLREEWLDPDNELFHSVVRSNFPSLAQLAENDRERVFSGDTYMADIGVSFGMLDGIASFASVLERAFELGHQYAKQTTTKIPVR